jgi:hypothetical protein
MDDPTIVIPLRILIWTALARLTFFVRLAPVWAFSSHRQAMHCHVRGCGIRIWCFDSSLEETISASAQVLSLANITTKMVAGNADINNPFTGQGVGTERNDGGHGDIKKKQ